MRPSGVPDHAYSRFAWICDPDGNKIELWQPLHLQAPTALDAQHADQRAGATLFRHHRAGRQ